MRQLQVATSNKNVVTLWCHSLWPFTNFNGSNVTAIKKATTSH